MIKTIKDQFVFKNSPLDFFRYSILANDPYTMGLYDAAKEQLEHVPVEIGGDDEDELFDQMVKEMAL